MRAHIPVHFSIWSQSSASGTAMTTNTRDRSLLRLKSPSEIPRPPISTASKYAIDVNERLVRADFLRDESWLDLDPVDETYLLGLFERPDVTVVIKGLAKCLTPHLWDIRYLNERCGTIMHHNFKCFSKAEGRHEGNFFANPEMEKAWSSMKVSDYIRYLGKRAAAVKMAATKASAAANENDEETIGVENGTKRVGNSAGAKRRNVRGIGRHEETMVFTSFDGKPRTVKLLEESVCLIDMNLTRYLPECAKDLDRKLMIDILPGGSKGALIYMPQESRPFLGPNLSITLPGSWTYFHQGGDGTVDAGHQCLAGRKRVIMLRRLNEADKRRAMRILAGDLSCRGNEEERGGGGEDPLYKPPQGHGRNIPWPSEEAIDLLRELNFCPSVFTLEPGEFVHINKGRLHAFRTEEPLPNEDPASVCMSVAWNWVFPGVTEAGCRGEIGYALQCAENNRRAKSTSIAPVETCLVQAAKSALAALRVRSLSERQAPSPTQPPSVRAASYAAPASAEKPSPSPNESRAVSAGSGGGAVESNKSVAKEAANGSSRRSSVLELYLRLRDSLSSEVKRAEEKLNPEDLMRAIAGVPVGGEGKAGGGAMKICSSVGIGDGVGADRNGWRASCRSGASGSSPVPVDPARTATRPNTGDDRAATGKKRLMSSPASPTLSSSSLLLLPPRPPQPLKSQPPVVLDSWITERSRSLEASAMDPTPARSLALESAAAAALQVLKNGAADAEASATQAKTSGKATNDATVATNFTEKCGMSYSVSAPGSFLASSSVAAASSAAGRSAMKTALLSGKVLANAATAAAGDGVFSRISALSQEGMDVVTVTGSAAKKGTRYDNSVVGGGGRAGEVGKLSEVDMLSALAPLLEEVVGRQRREWDMQCQAKEDSKKPPKLNPSRPGKRKLGPAAAKARNEAIVAYIQRMDKPIKQAVDRVEVDSSIPLHLQKANPFSVDDGFSCASCGCELFNAYMHCFGCDMLLNKSMNLCLGCHAQGRLSFPPLGQDEVGLTNRRHCPNVPKATLLQRELKAVGYRSTGHWIANRCPCLQDTCKLCHLCVACACDCHRRFQLRFRFEHPAHLERLVMDVRDAVSGGSTIPLHFGSENGASRKDSVDRGRAKGVNGGHDAKVEKNGQRSGNGSGRG